MADHDGLISKVADQDQTALASAILAGVRGILRGHAEPGQFVFTFPDGRVVIVSVRYHIPKEMGGTY